MDAQDAIDLGREAIRACMMIGGPILLISLIVGLALGLMQAMTQVQDQTVAFVPKLLIVLVGIAVCLPWLSDRMLEFSHDVLSKPMMMAHGAAVANEPVRSMNLVTVTPVAWPGLQPANAQSPALLPTQQRTPIWFEKNEANAQPSSPFQLPHYRFTKRPTDDLDG